MRRTDSNPRAPRRRNLAAFLMLLLPGFMFLGVLAPAAVTVKPIVEESAGPISFRSFTPRRPIQFPVAPVAIGARTLLTDAAVDPMFSGARYIADQAKRVFGPEASADARGEQIVLSENDTQEPAPEPMFDVAMEPSILAVDLTKLWDSSFFDVIPGLINRNGYSQWDDFHGAGIAIGGRAAQPAPVPEADTGVLLALGLVAIALRRRRA
jgi:hypothetical protein